MGRYESGLKTRLRLSRAAKRIKFPEGFKGAVMWCQLCAKEVMRVEMGADVTHAMQQEAVDAHAVVCVRRKLKLVP